MILVYYNINVLENQLEHWREVTEKNKLKIGKSKTEFFKFRFNNMIEGIGSDYNARLQGQLIYKAVKFKYIGSTVYKNERIMKNVTSKIRCSRMK